MLNKVLVVEDEIKNRDALISRLRHILGADALIEAAADGNEAIEKAERIQPQLVIMDIEMPHLNGIEASAVIHARLPDCRIVFLTAYERFDYAVRAMQVGSRDYLLKPASEERLRELLHRLFGELPAPAQERSTFAVKLDVWVREHYTEEITLDAAAQSMGISSYYFSRKVKTATGVTFLEYVTAYRIAQAKKRLLSTELSVAEIGRAVGYPDSNYFTKVFKRAEHCTPSQYRSAARESTGAP